MLADFNVKTRKQESDQLGRLQPPGLFVQLSETRNSCFPFLFVRSGRFALSLLYDRTFALPEEVRTDHYTSATSPFKTLTCASSDKVKS